jgi:dihydropteroate synthase
MHDLADIEGRGIPGVGVATTEFIDVAKLHAHALDYHAPLVFVPHPVQPRTDQEIHALADSAFERIVEAITAQPR